MKKFTKIIALALAVVLAFSLAACSGSNNGGDNASDKVIKIAVPNDTTNEARALLLLQEAGIIKLNDGAGITATAKDIVENPKNLQIKELEAANIPNALKDVDIACINGNYAQAAGLSVEKDALAVEATDSLAAETYANVLVVKDGNQDSEKIQALAKALKSDAVRDFINKTYEGAVVPVF